MDEKGRVALPAPFRREAGESPLVLLQWQSTHLTLFPQATWADVQARLVDYRRIDLDGQRFVRRVLSNAVEVTPDKQGRILIPAWLQQAADLSGTVLVVGQMNQIEVWDPTRFNAATSPEDAEAAKDFAHRIFL
jgi:MraZ protein